MFCHVTLKFNEINNFKQTRNLREIKRLVKFFNNHGVVQVSQTTGYESVLFWTSCKCLWTLYGAKTSECKSQFSSWSTHRIQQPIPKQWYQGKGNNLIGEVDITRVFVQPWFWQKNWWFTKITSQLQNRDQPNRKN